MRRLVPWLVALGLALSVTACGGGDRTATRPGTAGASAVTTAAPAGPLRTVTWALDSEPSSLDWVYSYDYPSNTVLANVCESLLRIDASFMASPGLAERVENPSPLEWVFRLRRGVRFHDGSPLTARDAAYSLRRHLDPAVGSYWSGFYRNVASIRATGPLQLTVRLRRPDVLFTSMLAVAGGVVAKEAAVREEGSRFGTPRGGVTCTGPFALEKWIAGRSIALRRFAGYWDREHAARVERLTFGFSGTARGLRQGLLSGRFDGMFGAPLRAGERGGTLASGPQTSTRNLVVSDLTGPLRDVRIRRALSLALDRRSFIRRTGLPGAEPSRAVAARLTWGQGEARSVYQRAYDALPPPVVDVEAARALVREAGRPSRPIVLAITDNAQHEALGRELVAAARRTGLPLVLRHVAADRYGALFTSARARRGIDLFHTTWYADVADPLEIYVNWQSANPANYAGWKSRAYDRTVARALAEADPVARARLVTRLQAQVSDELLWIPVEQSSSTLWMRPGLTGAPTTNAYLYYPWAAGLGARRP